MLNKDWIAIRISIPKDAYPWNSLSLLKESSATFNMPIKRIKNKNIKNNPPIIPSSSTRIAKIKSVWASGRKKFFWKLLPIPKPNHPP